jgi:hypothetical protein
MLTDRCWLRLGSFLISLPSAAFALCGCSPLEVSRFFGDSPLQARKGDTYHFPVKQLLVDTHSEIDALAGPGCRALAICTR